MIFTKSVKTFINLPFQQNTSIFSEILPITPIPFPRRTLMQSMCKKFPKQIFFNMPEDAPDGSEISLS